jgi:hypothetical protein
LRALGRPLEIATEIRNPRPACVTDVAGRSILIRACGELDVEL